MKNGNPCPKCGGNEVAFVPNPKIDRDETVDTGFMGILTVRLDRFICLTCGFNEDWVDCQEGIERLRQYQIR